MMNQTWGEWWNANVPSDPVSNAWAEKIMEEDSGEASETQAD